MQIKLNNGEILTPILITGSKPFVQGATRDTLQFVFPASANMEELNAAFSAENCETITVNEAGAEHIYKGYTVRHELKRANVEVQPATAETAAVYEERVFVAMSQRTYMESQLALLQAQVSQLVGVQA